MGFRHRSRFGRSDRGRQKPRHRSSTIADDGAVACCTSRWSAVRSRHHPRLVRSGTREIVLRRRRSLPPTLPSSSSPRGTMGFVSLGRPSPRGRHPRASWLVPPPRRIARRCHGSQRQTLPVSRARPEPERKVPSTRRSRTRLRDASAYLPTATSVQLQCGPPPASSVVTLLLRTAIAAGFLILDAHVSGDVTIPCGT